MLPYAPYAPRPIRYHGTSEHEGWRLKRYSIHYGEGRIDEPAFVSGEALALTSLPADATTEARPGVGFLILHQGRGMNYVVLGWWDRENELPVRVFVSAPVEGHRWRPAEGSESFCVWDLQVLWFERQAYVETVLRPGGCDPVDAYLTRVLASGEA